MPEDKSLLVWVQWLKPFWETGDLQTSAKKKFYTRHACLIRNLSCMEELEIVSEETGMPQGQYVARHEAIHRGLWCRSTNVFVMNSDGHILCHQRSLGKERMPGYWSTHLGGHVSRHETFETNALKELEEEAGIQIQPEQLIPWRTTKLNSACLWVREFVALVDVPLEQLVPQPGEVECFAWKSFQEIDQAAKQKCAPWCAGTHDFRTEYHCLLAVLTAAHAIGVTPKPVKYQLV